MAIKDTWTRTEQRNHDEGTEEEALPPAEGQKEEDQPNPCSQDDKCKGKGKGECKYECKYEYEYKGEYDKEYSSLSL